MTKKLEELLNIAPTPDTTAEQSQEFITNNKAMIAQVDAAITKIDEALPLVKDLEAGDRELDELSTIAKDKANELIELGMNVDPRFAGPILQTASNMLGHAVSAKTAKMDKKLRMISLQLQKARLDHAMSKDAGNPNNPEPVNGQGVVLDRNALLSAILAANKAK